MSTEPKTTLPHIRNLSPLAFPRLWQTLGWLLVTAVIVLSLLPEPPQPPLITSDKAQHLLTYAVLMLWFAQAFSARVHWAAFLVGLGVALEFLQGLTEYRQFEYADMLANTLGVGCGLLLAATPLGATIERLDHALTVWVGG